MRLPTSQIVRNWSLWGFFMISLLGTLYHYLFEWTNHAACVAPFVPVNESVWEHLKLGLWGVLSFSVVEYFVIGKRLHNYFFAKAMGVVIISLAIVVLFYSYTSIFKRNLLFIDISIFLLGIAFCQLFFYQTVRKKGQKWLDIFGIILIVSLCVLFAIFTFYPPHWEIFQDSRFQTYGISIPTT